MRVTLQQHIYDASPHRWLRTLHAVRTTTVCYRTSVPSVLFHNNAVVLAVFVLGVPGRSEAMSGHVQRAVVHRLYLLAIVLRVAQLMLTQPAQ